MDQNNLQQEEKDWYRKATLENKAKVEAIAKNTKTSRKKEMEINIGG